MHKAMLPSNQTEVTMSSREIAALTNKSHGNVSRDIRNMMEQLQKDVFKFEEIFFDSYGREQKQYRLDRIHVECLLMGYSAVLRMKVLERLKELEAQLAKPSIPTSFAEALRLAADQQEQIQQLALTNQQQASRIDALEQLLAAGVTAPDFCRRLNGVNTMEINAYLHRAGWLFDSGNGRSRWRVASYARDKYMTEQAVEIKSGTADAFSAVKAVLLKAGAQRLLKLYLSSKLPMKRSWDGELKHDLVGVVGVAA